MISDYCCGDGDLSQDFCGYVNEFRYHIIPRKDYANLIKEAGFTQVKSYDMTGLFVEVLEDELRQTAGQYAEYLADPNLSEHDYDYILNRWQAKIDRAMAGDQKWAFFEAKK